MDKESVEKALDNVIDVLKNDAAETINFCSDESLVTPLGETHKAFIKALESFKDIIISIT